MRIILENKIHITTQMCFNFSHFRYVLWLCCWCAAPALQNVYPDWCQGCPSGTFYNLSKCGWFDMFSFTYWCRKVFLPQAKRQVGPKLMIGDNLTSHISSADIKECINNNIRDRNISVVVKSWVKELTWVLIGCLKTNVLSGVKTLDID